MSFPLADSTSVATDYSLKFDESMTEDEIEERSFRSLLPSEAHRRVTLDKKSRPHEESEEEPASHDRSLASMPLNRSKVREACQSLRAVRSVDFPAESLVCQWQGWTEENGPFASDYVVCCQTRVLPLSYR